jgi:hypothetical protein
MVTHKRPDSAPVELVFYPGVCHAFDVKLLQAERRAIRTIGSNTTSRRPRTQKKKPAHSLPLISLRLPPASRLQRNTQVG